MEMGHWLPKVLRWPKVNSDCWCLPKILQSNKHHHIGSRCITERHRGSAGARRQAHCFWFKNSNWMPIKIQQHWKRNACYCIWHAAISHILVWQIIHRGNRPQTSCHHMHEVLLLPPGLNECWSKRRDTITASYIALVTKWFSQTQSTAKPWKEGGHWT